MGAFLQNTTAPDTYPVAPQLGSDGGSSPYERGQILIANNPIVLTVYRGKDRSSITGDEYLYVTPSLIPLVRGRDEYIYGVKFRNAIAGSAAQVSGYLIEPGVAGLGAGSAFTQQVSSGGSVTPGVSSVQVQKNGVLIGTEPIIDLIDKGNATWTVADDTVNTRVTVSPSGYTRGQASCTFPGGTQQSNTTTVTHNLGTTPTCVLVSISGATGTGTFDFILLATNYTPTTFDLTTFCPVANPPAASSAQISWLAIP